MNIQGLAVSTLLVLVHYLYNLQIECWGLAVSSLHFKCDCKYWLTLDIWFIRYRKKIKYCKIYRFFAHNIQCVVGVCFYNTKLYITYEVSL